MLDSSLDLLAHGFAGPGIGWRLAYFLAATQVTVIAVTLYLHRSQTHRAVEFHPVLAHAFRFWIWLTTAMVTREWVAIHRKHHAYSDTARDPHSPHVFGVDKLLLQGAELYIDARADERLLLKYGRGVPDDWIERHVYTPHCNWGPTLLAFVNLALFGVGGMAIWALQMIWIPFWGAGVVNGIGHWRGYRNFETADRSANLVRWGVWVGGEELHNNHHAFPASAKFSVHRFEFDLGWFLIRVLDKLRMADVRCAVGANGEAASANAHARRPRVATLAPRVEVMTDFYNKVMLPVVRDHDGSGDRQSLSGPLRRALADGGRWLAAGERERLETWIDSRPVVRLLCEFRAQLAVLMDRRLRVTSEEFSQWRHAAKASNIGLLRDFAISLQSDATPDVDRTSAAAGRPGATHIPLTAG
ncbi:acyl-CoA desaturase [Dokdonella sp.]|uniref:DesA family fatty acid desaturase n=1 Tax=Dokdonella sp. TaxID=2291710 RepID=UPI003783EB08